MEVIEQSTTLTSIGEVGERVCAVQSINCSENEQRCPWGAELIGVLAPRRLQR